MLFRAKDPCLPLEDGILFGWETCYAERWIRYAQGSWWSPSQAMQDLVTQEDIRAAADGAMASCRNLILSSRTFT